MRTPRSGLVAMLLAAGVAATGCDGGIVPGPRDAAVADAPPRRDAAPTDVTAPRDAIAPTDVGSEPPSDVASAPDVVVARDATPDANDGGRGPCPALGSPVCSPGTGTGMGDQCGDAPSCFVTNVQNAVRRVIAANPSWFDQTTMPSCAIVLQGDNYMDAVVADLRSQGLCAIRDPNAPGEEVTVKHDNAFSENFDILASTGCARHGGAIYTSYCAPAWW